jgi:hypothetical protein
MCELGQYKNYTSRHPSGEADRGANHRIHFSHQVAMFARSTLDSLEIIPDCRFGINELCKRLEIECAMPSIRIKPSLTRTLNTFGITQLPGGWGGHPELRDFYTYW